MTSRGWASRTRRAEKKRHERRSRADGGDDSGWPAVIVSDGAGGFLIRGCVGRAKALRIVRGHAADDVIFIQLAGLQIELSFHDSIPAAELALEDAIQRGTLAGAPAEGEA